jgi:hypothetical protein
MPITVEMMKAASQAGLSIVCASCELYWEARDKGLVGDQCLAKNGCGSPLAGDCFHEYRGIMTVDAFRKFCFVCGDDATHRLDHPTWPRVIGVCRDHVEWMKDAKMRQPQRRPYVDAPPNGKKFELPPEESLIGKIVRTEIEWAQEGGYEFDPKEFLKGDDAEEKDAESLDDGEAEV